MSARRWWCVGAVCGAATLAACGGYVNTTPIGTASPTVTYTAVPQATAAPFDVTVAAEAVPAGTANSADAAPIALALASNATAIGEMDLGSLAADIPDGTTLDAETTNEALTDAPAPTGSLRRVTEATAAKTHIETVIVKFSNTVKLKKRPTFVFTFATGFLTTANYYLQVYDSSQPGLAWQDPFEGPATISGSTLLFDDASNVFTFSGGVKYFFDLYAVSERDAPTPFPAPSSTGTAAPGASPSPSPIFGLLTVTPNAVAFTAGGQTEVLSAAEAGYSGAFTATVADPTLATITPGLPGQFTLAALGQPGSSQVIVTDGEGQKVKVPFTVTITTGTISGVHRTSTTRRPANRFLRDALGTPTR